MESRKTRYPTQSGKTLARGPFDLSSYLIFHLLISKIDNLFLHRKTALVNSSQNLYSAAGIRMGDGDIKWPSIVFIPKAQV